MAFVGCTSLTSVTIPNSVTNIGDYAFAGCTSLSAITVDALNSSYSSVDGVLLNKSQTRLIQCPGGKAGSYAIANSVEATTNLANASWVPLKRFNLTNGAFYFSDPDWANYATRTYRIRSP